MVGLIGISHQTARIEIREQLVFTQEDITGIYEHLYQKCGIEGILVLSTCNRTEIYFELSSVYIENTEKFVEKVCNTFIAYIDQTEDLKQYLYSYSGNDCARHLFRVASGLEALILGEYQIVAQLKDAFAKVDKTAMIGPILTRMVHKAFKASKMVRTHTALNTGAVSVSSAAVELVSQKLPHFPDIQTLTVGAGETGSIVASNLNKKGCTRQLITSRTYDHAKQLATTHEALALPFENYLQNIQDTDVIFFTTASKDILLSKSTLAPIMKTRSDKPLMLVDLSNPRNVSTDVNEIEGVTLYDLDHMEEVVHANFEKRKGELGQAEKLIEEVVEEFDDWMNMRRMRATINTLTATFKRVHAHEVKNYKNKHADNIDNQLIEEYGTHLNTKLTRMIIKQMKNFTQEGREADKVRFLEEFFTFEY